MKIHKSTGEQVEFDEKKISSSSKRAGATDELAKEVVREVRKKVKKGDSTDDVYKQVLSCLIDKDSRVAARYSLKRAIMRLGPAGYVFERYVGAIMHEHGYKTATGLIVKGKCITHEVDLVAHRDDVHIIGEAKYHNRAGIHSGAKDALYTWARFQDIVARMEKVEPEKNKHESWLFTNTKVSRDVREYANCVGMTVVSWKYSNRTSLRDLIEKKALYPITIIPSIKQKELERLSLHKTIFALDLLKYSAEEISVMAGMKRNRAEKILKEINTICR